MRGWLPLVLPGAAGVAVAASPGPEVAPFVAFGDPVVVLEHMRVIDGTGAPARVPEGARRFDGTGYTVIPGLVGLHDHL